MYIRGLYNKDTFVRAVRGFGAGGFARSGEGGRLGKQPRILGGFF